MRITDIMADAAIVEAGIRSSHKWRKLTDARAVPGAAIEVEICKGFNATSNTHKMLTQQMLETLCGQYVFDYSKFAQSYDDLKKKTKIDFGPISAADLFLFEKSGNHLVLVDAASLKTSAAFGGKSVEVFAHNDASGEIHKHLKHKTGGDKSIGNIVAIVVRDADYRVYHFDKPLSALQGDFQVIGENQHGDLFYGTNNKRLFKSTNRFATSGRKATSFNRGLKIQSKSTKKDRPFDCFEALVGSRTFSQLLSATVPPCSTISDLITEMNL
jgi:hypothetical protein